MKTRRRARRERIALNLFARWMSAKPPERCLERSPWVRERSDKTAAQHRAELASKIARSWIGARSWCGPAADPFCAQCGGWVGRWANFVSATRSTRDTSVLIVSRFCSRECMPSAAALAAADSLAASASPS